MPARKTTAKRTNPSLSGLFEQHLQFLQRSTGMTNTSIIKLAVADLAKSRGFVEREDKHDRKKP